jgi:pimeloyl-ACP methyl ester carboxylesterase
MANAMISAYGGDRWCRDMILRWAGSNPKGLASLKADDSLEVYSNFFRQTHVINASNEDYAAGATIDVDMQEADQKAGRKIHAPVFLLYSEKYLGSRYDVPKEWQDWVEEGVRVKSFAMDNGVGHFDTEEDPELSAKVFREWLRELKIDA